MQAAALASRSDKGLCGNAGLAVLPAVAPPTMQEPWRSLNSLSTDFLVVNCYGY